MKTIYGTAEFVRTTDAATWTQGVDATRWIKKYSVLVPTHPTSDTKLDIEKNGYFVVVLDNAEVMDLNSRITIAFSTQEERSEFLEKVRWAEEPTCR